MDQLKQIVLNLDDKISKTQEDISDIKQILAGQAVDLKYHIHRTNLAEDRLDILQNETRKNTVFRDRVEWTFKLIGIGCTGLGLLFAGVKALDLFT